MKRSRIYPDESKKKAQVTDWLAAWKAGDDAALELVLNYFYQDLKNLAHHNLTRESRDPGMQTTELVHHMFISLVEKKEITYQDRSHFFRVAALAMRRVLIVQARKAASQKRGAYAMATTLEEELFQLQQGLTPDLWLQVDEALEQLAIIDKEIAELVTLRFFGGYTTEEISHLLDMSTATVTRKWKFAKVWLYSHMKEQ